MFKKWIKNNKTIFILSITFLFLLLVFITFLILRTNKDFCDFYTLNFLSKLNGFTNKINSIFPFSLIEIIVIRLAVIGVTLLVLIIKEIIEKSYKTAIKKGLIISNTVMLIFSMFMIHQGLQYNRNPINLNFYQERVSQSQYKEIVKHFINDFNYCADQLEYDENNEIKIPYSYATLEEKINALYDKCDFSFLSKNYVHVNRLLFSHLFSEFSITGVTYLNLGEVSINYLCPNSILASTISHEMAHAKGISKENDAQNIACYILLHSDDPYLKYNGYFMSYSSLLTLANYTGNKEDYKEMKDLISIKIKNNQKYYSNFWKSYSHLQDFADWVNNLFLKSNGDSEGTSSYIDRPIIDDEDKDIATYSNYQKIFFSLYFN